MWFKEEGNQIVKLDARTKALSVGIIIGMYDYASDAICHSYMNQVNGYYNRFKAVA